MTPEEHADNIARWTNKGLRQAIIDEIAVAVAQAVQQEREACRVAASKAIMRIRTDRMQDNTMAELKMICAGAAEDAIRARGGKGEG